MNGRRRRLTTALLVLISLAPLTACGGGAEGAPLAAYEQVSAEDREVLDGLVDAGADLDESREVRHYLYFDGEAPARDAASRAERAGWATTVNEPSSDIPQWAVEAVREATLTPEFVEESTDFFEGLADVPGGDYDGWEAAV